MSEDEPELEKVDDEIDSAREALDEEEPDGPEPGPWAKTSSGDAEEI